MRTSFSWETWTIEQDGKPQRGVWIPIRRGACEGPLPRCGMLGRLQSVFIGETNHTYMGLDRQEDSPSRIPQISSLTGTVGRQLTHLRSELLVSDTKNYFVKRQDFEIRVDEIHSL